MYDYKLTQQTHNIIFLETISSETETGLYILVLEQ